MAEQWYVLVSVSTKTVKDRFITISLESELVVRGTSLFSFSASQWRRTHTEGPCSPMTRRNRTTRLRGEPSGTTRSRPCPLLTPPLRYKGWW